MPIITRSSRGVLAFDGPILRLPSMAAGYGVVDTHFLVACRQSSQPFTTRGLDFVKIAGKGVTR
jgi:hypothetical protein